MGIHANRPWRQVVRIEDCVGGHGGEYWLLTLSCRHVVARSKPPFRPWKISEPIERFLAPERVRCIHCSTEK